MRQLLLGLIVAVAVITGLTPATLAINDPTVPADECSPDNSAAVGDPEGGNPGINGPHTPQVSPPVSLNNPGASTGAKGQEKAPAEARRRKRDLPYLPLSPLDCLDMRSRGQLPRLSSLPLRRPRAPTTP